MTKASRQSLRKDSITLLLNQFLPTDSYEEPKIYCIDHSMITSVAPGILADRGHLLENIIYIHLRRRTEEIYYYRTKKGQEVDFIWLDCQGKRHLMQVCLSLGDPATKKREISSLNQAMEELNLGESTIITFEEEDVLEEGSKLINIVPVWQFLLKEERCQLSIVK